MYVGVMNSLYTKKMLTKHLPIYVFLKEIYRSRGLISPSFTTNDGGMLPNLKSHNYDGICQIET